MIALIGHAISGVTPKGTSPKYLNKFGNIFDKNFKEKVIKIIPRQQRYKYNKGFFAAFAL